MSAAPTKCIKPNKQPWRVDNEGRKISHNYYKALYAVHVNLTTIVYFSFESLNYVMLYNVKHERANRYVCIICCIFCCCCEVSQLQNFLLSNAKIRLLVGLLFTFLGAIFTAKKLQFKIFCIRLKHMVHIRVRRYDHFSSDVEPSFKNFYFVLLDFASAYVHHTLAHHLQYLQKTTV